MLIKCNKHTKEDLELWESYNEADIIYYNMHDMKEKEKRAVDLIKKINPDYVSISWGKDSTVLAHLCYKSGHFNYVWFRNQYENPYCYMVKDIYIKKYNINNFEIFKKVSLENIKNDFINFHSLKCHKIAEKKFGKKYMTGIRIEESGIRKVTILKNGIYSNNRSSPIAFWKNEDIFAYLAFYKLPVHPNYAMLGGGRYNRKNIRVGPLTMASQFGQKQWEKEYYFNEINKINAI